MAAEGIARRLRVPCPLMLESHFHYERGRLSCGNLDLADLADRFGTPLYVYSADTIARNFRQLAAAFAPLDPLVCYAVKANANLAILRTLVALGAGLDVVSEGELFRARLAGTPMSSVVFAGVAKTGTEIAAALDLDAHAVETADTAPARGPVRAFNVESPAELERIREIARDARVTADVCLRLNPDVDAATHPYITTGTHENKFGMDADSIRRIIASRPAADPVNIRGIHLHLGSQIASPDPYRAAIPQALDVLDHLSRSGLMPDTLNIGGGFAVDYEAPFAAAPSTPAHGSPSPQAPAIAAFANAIIPLLQPRTSRGLRLILEPGRALIADAGVLLTRVQYLKHSASRTFAICDAGMHTLLRPALYDAYHFIWPAVPADPRNAPTSRTRLQPFAGLLAHDVVGPICESSDFLAQQRQLPQLGQGDILAVFHAGAYGMSMASTYNEHPRPAEVLVDRGQPRLIRRRQTVADLVRDDVDAPSSAEHI